MRFYLFGSRPIMGVRAGVSFGPEDFRAARSSGARSSCDGFVYVIKRADGHIKVGTTSNPPQRLRTLQTGNAIRLSYAFVAGTSGDGTDVEAEAHKLLGHYHMIGDWFETTPEVAISAVYAAAARRDRSLVTADPTSAERHVPAMPGGVFGPAEKRRGTRNMIIVAAAVLAAAMAVSWAFNFMDTANVGTPYNPLPGGVITRP